MGSDDRRTVVDSVEWPWSAIGRLNNSTGRICTATLVVPDAVLTAAHCLADVDTGRLVPPSAVHFLAGYRRGEYVAHAQGTSIEIGSLPDRQRPTGAEDIAGDWAIVHVAPPPSVRPIPVADSAQSGTATMDRPAAASGAGARLQRAGYGQDRPHMLAVHDGCRVTRVLAAGRLLLTDCDATRGDSGSPLLLRDGTEVSVLGVTSAVVDRDATRAALVVSSTQFRALLGRSTPPGAARATTVSPGAKGRP